MDNRLTRHIYAAIITAALFILPLSAQAQKVTVDAAIDSLQIYIGQQARITLDISCEKGQKVDLPVVLDTLVRGIEVVDIAKPDTQMLNGGRRIQIREVYTVTSFDSSLYYIPPFEVLVDGQARKSQELALKVYYPQVDIQHPDQFFGPKDIREIPITWQDVKGLTFESILFILGAAIAIYLLIRYKDNKPVIRIIKIEPKKPPRQAALEGMRQIRDDKKQLMNDPKEYYTRLTDVLREFINSRFGFNATEMTSSEIIERLSQAEEAGGSLDELRSLFTTADLVKFAKFAPMLNENDQNLLNAVEFIKQTGIIPEENEKQEPTEIKVEEKRSKEARAMLLTGITILLVADAALIYFILKNIWRLWL